MSLLLLEEDVVVLPPKPPLKLPIDKRESSHYQSRQGYPCICVVEHIAVAPTFDNLVSYLLNNNRSVSAQFVIGGDYVGQWALLVGSTLVGQPSPSLLQEKLRRAANHCGVQSFPNTNPRPDIGNSNWFTWGKEHVGYPGQVWTPAMLQNDKDCNAYVRQVIGPAAFTYITGHYNFDPRNRTNCPGPTFPWSELYGLTPRRLTVESARINLAMTRIPESKLKALPVGDHDAYNELLKEYSKGVQ